MHLSSARCQPSTPEDPCSLPPEDAGAEAGEAFYDEMWRRYARLDAVSPAAFHRRRLLITRLCHLPLPAQRILDVGCGQGELLHAIGLRLRSAELSGADISARSLSLARRRVPEADLFQLRLGEPAFERTHTVRLGRYDAVLCSEVLEHLADDVLAVGQLVSLVAPGGYLLVTVPAGAMTEFDRTIGHVRHYRVRQLAQLLRASGLSDCEVSAWGFPFHSAYRLAVRLGSRWSVSSVDRPDGPAGQRQRAPWEGAYRAAGRVLRPLFYLNLDRWGSQLIAVGRRGCP